MSTYRVLFLFASHDNRTARLLLKHSVVAPEGGGGDCAKEVKGTKNLPDCS